MKKCLIALIALMTLALGMLFVPAVTKAADTGVLSSASVEKKTAPEVLSAKVNGVEVTVETLSMSEVATTISDAAVLLSNAYNELSKTEDLTTICKDLTKVAQAIDKSYKSGAVFEVTDIFDLAVPAGTTISEANPLTVVLQATSADAVNACIHQVNGEKWETAEVVSYDSASKTATVKFTSLCPVALLSVSPAKVAAQPASTTAYWIAIIVLIVVVIVLLILLIMEKGKGNKNGANAQETNERIGELEKKLEESEKARKKAEEEVEAGKIKAAEAEKEAEIVKDHVEETEVEVGAAADVAADGKRYFSITFNRSFTAKMANATDEAKEYYSAIKNELAAYGSKGYPSWRFENYRVGRAFPIKLAVRGKTLCVYLNLDPKSLAETKYNVEDVSDSASYESTPSLFRVNGSRKLKHACELIAMVMEKYNREKVEIETVDYAAELTSCDEKDLIAAGLIKVNVMTSNQENERATSFEISSETNKITVNDLMDDKTAAILVKQSEKVADPTKKATVHLDVISNYFQNGETVTLDELKNRVPDFNQDVTWYQIAAGKSFDKELTIVCDGYTLEAVKMVVLVGGTVECTQAE